MVETPPDPRPVEEGPLPKRWTREEYLGMAEKGFLGEGSRTELIDGNILDKMPQGNAHILAVKLLFYALQAAFSEESHLAVQSTLPLSDDAMPEPDLLVLQGGPRDYSGRDPDPKADILLLVEVSDTTLTFDRTDKTRLYAANGVPEYWILDLRHRTLEIRRRPLGEGYAETLILQADETVTVGNGTILVADVLS